MSIKSIGASLALASIVALGSSCASPSEEADPSSPEEAAERVTETPERVEPDAVRVQHVLIGFQDAIGFKDQVPEGAAGRTEAQARELAASLLARAQSGEDFEALVIEFTDDEAPGIYGMTNHEVAEREGYSPRGRMVTAFGDVSFSLAVGEIGMTTYDPATSKYGWHIIKRIE